MLFKNITILDENLEVREHMFVGTKNAYIAYIGTQEPREDYGRIYDGSGKLLMSAFYNCHGHSPMALMRGYGENMALQDWLTKRIFPFEDKRECIDKLKDYFTNHPKNGRFLMNCKMRFGKSYTSYKFCEEMGLDRILILTFVPAVENSWRDDLEHIAKEYRYRTDDDLRRIEYNPSNETDPFVMFLSLQNYLGKEKNSKETKTRLKKLQSINWDLVILDEYHFGACPAQHTSPRIRQCLISILK